MPLKADCKARLSNGTCSRRRMGVFATVFKLLGSGLEAFIRKTKETQLKMKYLPAEFVALDNPTS